MDHKPISATFPEVKLFSIIMVVGLLGWNIFAIELLKGISGISVLVGGGWLLFNLPLYLTLLGDDRESQKNIQIVSVCVIAASLGFIFYVWAGYEYQENIVRLGLSNGSDIFVCAIMGLFSHICGKCINKDIPVRGFIGAAVVSFCWSLLRGGHTSSSCMLNI